MKKILKKLLFGVLGLLLFAMIGIGIFIYKVKYGLPFYDKTPPSIPAEIRDFSIINFTKTNAFRHGSAIEESTKQLEKMAK